MTFPTFYIPHANTIQNISNDEFAVVTTDTDHGYQTGYLIRIVYPPGSHFGMDQLNGNIYAIGVIDNLNFVMSVDTKTFDPFSLGINSQFPQCIPVGVTREGIPPLYQESEKNNGNMRPAVSWTNTTFPWINSNSTVRH